MRKLLQTELPTRRRALLNRPVRARVGVNDDRRQRLDRKQLLLILHLAGRGSQEHGDGNDLFVLGEEYGE